MPVLDKAMRQHLSDARSRRIQRDGTDIPASVLELENKLREFNDPMDIDEILAAIEDEYARARMPMQQIETAKLRLMKQPDNVLAHISLAMVLSQNTSSPEVANETKAHARIAAECALAQNTFVRYALTQQAWIAIYLGDIQLYHEAIERLIEDAKSGRTYEIDSGFFPTVVDDAPPGFCTPELAERYHDAIGS